MESQETQSCQPILRRKNRTGRIILPDFRQHYKATIITTVWYWHKNCHMDHWNRTEHPEINPHTYGQLMFNTEGKNIQWRQSPQQVTLGKLDSHMQMSEIRTLPHTIHESKLRMA